MGTEQETGGERLIIPLNFRRHSRTTQFSSGYEPVNMTIQTLGTPGGATWFDAVRPVVISGHEERINRGTYKVLDVLQERTKDTFNGMKLEFQQHLLRGDQPNMSDLEHLNGIDDTTDGFLEAAAVGAQSNSVMNVSKATYSFAPGWNNQWFDGGGSFSANGLIGLQDLTTRITELAGEGSLKLKGYLSIACANNLKRALRTFERYISEKEYDAGRQIMVWDGTGLEVLRDLPSTGTNSTAAPMSALFVDWSSVKFVKQAGAYFDSGAFDTQSGYNVRASFLHLMGQLKTNYLGSSAIMTDAEAF